MEISEDLRTAHREATRRDDRSACPSSADLSAFANPGGEDFEALDAERRSALADHVMDCAECALEVRLARDIHGYFFGEAGSGTEEDVAAPAIPITALTFPTAPTAPTRRSWLPPTRWVRGTAMAAAVVLAAFAVWLAGVGTLDQGPRSSSPVERSTSAGAVTPADGAVLDQGPTVFEWPPESGAEGYRVEILDGAARSVWRSSWQAEPRLDLPGDVLLDVLSGDYLWTVEVRGEVSRRELGPFAFKLE